jgi:hypothetical protein
MRPEDDPRFEQSPDSADSLGSVDADVNSVPAYIAAAYETTLEGARKACVDHHAILSDGMRLGSMAFYVGDKIAAAAHLTAREDS